MIRGDYFIPIYNVHLTLIQVTSSDDAERIKDIMLSSGITEQEYIDYTINGIKNNAEDGGETYRNLSKKEILCIFYKMSDKDTKEEIYAHEKRHVEDRILEFFEIDDLESAALLAGYLGRLFYLFKKCKNERNRNI